MKFLEKFINSHYSFFFFWVYLYIFLVHLFNLYTFIGLILVYITLLVINIMKKFKKFSNFISNQILDNLVLLGILIFFAISIPLLLFGIYCLFLPNSIFATVFGLILIHCSAISIIGFILYIKNMITIRLSTVLPLYLFLFVVISGVIVFAVTGNIDDFFNHIQLAVN